MDVFKIFRQKKRKYPIQRDRDGLSLRARCFTLFDQGKRPVKVAEEMKMKETTVNRYFRDWKRLGPDFERTYAYVQSLFKKSAPNRDKNIELFAGQLGISNQQFTDILSQPHGLRRLMTGKIKLSVRDIESHKLSVALELAILISDHLTKKGGRFEDVYFTFERWLKRDKAYREGEDEDIRQWNETVQLIRRIIQVEMENEEAGRVQSERLTPEEQETILKWRLQSAVKNAERMYWFKIGELMAGGLSKEEAREKLYQALIEKGDIEGAKKLRAYQDSIHPLKPTDQSPPKSPSQPQPPA